MKPIELVEAYAAWRNYAAGLGEAPPVPLRTKALAGKFLVEAWLQTEEAIEALMAGVDWDLARKALRWLYRLDTQGLTYAEDLVDRNRIADRLGVAKKTVATWGDRYDDFPQPFTVFGNVPVWEWVEVLVWAIQKGRA